MVIFRIEVADPPGPKGIVLGFREVRGPVGEEESVRVRVPEKPPRLLTVIVVVAESPCMMVKDDGLAVSWKSTTWTVIVTECESEPLVPVTVMV